MSWIYEKSTNNSARFVLGETGKKTIICIGVNPSTATPDKLDPTLESVKRIAKHNGFDGWIMLNIYAQRSTDPTGVDTKLNIRLHRLNLQHIEEVIKNTKGSIWAAWGTNIEERDFYGVCLQDINAIVKNNKRKWVSIGETKDGHPRHPLYKSSISLIQQFEFGDYISKLL